MLFFFLNTKLCRRIISRRFFIVLVRFSINIEINIFRHQILSCRQTKHLQRRIQLFWTGCSLRTLYSLAQGLPGLTQPSYTSSSPLSLVVEVYFLKFWNRLSSLGGISMQLISNQEPTLMILASCCLSLSLWTDEIHYFIIHHIAMRLFV